VAKVNVLVLLACNYSCQAIKLVFDFVVVKQHLIIDPSLF